MKPHLTHNRLTRNNRPRRDDRRRALDHQHFLDLRSRWTRTLNVTPAQPAIHRALTEAEALAWQTPFPHLVYPMLAEEKVRRAQSWLRRQSDILARPVESCFAV